MGDSLTAGFGALATSYWDICTEYRGVSWSIGGDSDLKSGVITLPNLFKLYNSNIQGFSEKTGKATSPNSKLDRAVTGSRAPDMIAQAQDLVDKMKSDTSINMQEDWKIITIWVGSNDLCDICNDDEQKYSPDSYENNLRAAISIIREEIPRAFVNLIQGIDPTQLYELKSGWCEWLHWYECPCGSSSDANVRASVTERLQEYNDRLIKIANDTIFQGDDFAVVIQPFLTHTDIPKDEDGNPDTHYFALDCFHFSGLAHEAAAVGIWNNLFQKVSYKNLNWIPGEPFICPEDGQFISTVANS